jgi:hypothetical protein
MAFNGLLHKKFVFIRRFWGKNRQKNIQNCDISVFLKLFHWKNNKKPKYLLTIY